MSSSSSSSSSSTINKPYGSWGSSITSKAITAGSVKLGPLYYFNNTLYWLEGRPREGGRNVLCRYHPPPSSLTDDDNYNDDEVAGNSSISDVTPPTANVRSRVHEYGGGAVIFGNHDNDSDIYYTEFTTQQLCRLVNDDSSSSIPITGVNGTTAPPSTNDYRYADGVLSSNGKYIYCIREDHTIPTNVINEIVCIDINPPPPSSSSGGGGGTTTGKTTIVATGNDFYSHPRLSPNDDNQLIYITWNHPAMPWDDTELRKIDNLSLILSEEEEDEEKEKKLILTKYHTLIAGNVDNNDDDQEEGTSILQPSFHPITGELYYISDESGYYNIYKQRQRQTNNNDNEGVSVLPMSYDFGGPSPGWVLGQQGYTFMTDGRLVAQYSKDGKSILVIANVMTEDDNNNGAATNICEYIGGEDDDILPITFGGIVTSTTNNDGSIYFLGGSPSTPTSIYRWDSANPTLPARIVKCSSNVQFSSSIISTPRRIEFPTSDNKTAFGYYYPPRNDGYACTADDDDDDDVKPLPPLLVKAHGGPTSCTSCSYNAAIQYWTSRGFAILDVDYGGSTGYGRNYRRRLYKNWGIVDVDDVCNGATYLVNQGLVDANRLCIDGGSAGGYTTLCALAYRTVFKAGTSLYGIGDLTLLAGDTHKFESHYLDGLVGKYPNEKQLYKDRSPIESIDTLSCPILLLQGVEDKVVPPNQAMAMYEALLKKGIPTCLKLYEGEQHGFRKAENIEDALDSELAFYGKVFGIMDIPGVIELKVDNL